MAYYYVPSPGATVAATDGGYPVGYTPLTTDISMYSPRPYVNYVNYRPYANIGPNPFVDANQLIGLMREAANRNYSYTPMAPTRARTTGTTTGSRQTPPTADKPAEPASSQPATSKPAEPIQSSPGVYNGTSNIGDNYKLTLRDVSTGMFPPPPPATPSAPAVTVTEPSASSNYRLRNLYENAQDLVGAPDPVSDSDPVPSNGARQVYIPTSPVDRQSEFMTQTELASTTPMASGTVVDNTPSTLSDVSATVSDYIKAMMLPYYQAFMQGRSVGNAMRNNMSTPQIGIPAIPGTIPTAPVIIP